MDQMIELLRIAHCYRQQPAEEAVGRFPFEVGVVNEIVGNTIDIPRNANGIDQSQDQHDPEWSVWEQEEHRNHKSGMGEHGEHRNPVFIGMGQNLHIAVDSDTFMVNGQSCNPLRERSPVIY